MTDDHRAFATSVGEFLAEEYEPNREAAERAAIAKYRGTEMQGRLVDVSLQLHGGYGYMPEYRISELYADARAQRNCGGINEIMREGIARSLDSE